MNQNEELLKKVNKFFKDIVSYRETEKVAVLKEDQVKNFKFESDENCAKIKNKLIISKISQKY